MSTPSSGGSGGGAPRPFRVALPSFTDAAERAQQSQAPRPPPSRPRPPAPTTTAAAAAAGGAAPPLPSLPPRAYAPYRPNGGAGAAGMGGPHPSAARPPPPPPQQQQQPRAMGPRPPTMGPGAAAAGGGPRPPAPLPYNPSKGGYVIAASPRQQGNPVLKHIRNVPYEFVEGITPDFVLGASTCCLYISLRFHLLQPQYLIRRIKELRRDYRLRVILCLVDAEDSAGPLLEINRMALMEECTLLLAWSTLEAARYLETFKAYEHKGCESIQERVDAEYGARLSNALTSIRAINKTDAMTLSSNLGSLADIMRAPKKDLVMCPGLGDVKVQRLWETFHEPFLLKPGSKAKAAAAAAASSAGGGRGETGGGAKRRKKKGAGGDTLRARILAAEGVAGGGVAMEEDGSEEGGGEEDEEARWEAVGDGIDDEEGTEGGSSGGMGGGGLGRGEREDPLDYGSDCGDMDGARWLLEGGGGDDG